MLMTSISKKFRWAVLFLVVAGLGFCTIRREPDRVWNLREKIVTLSKSLVGVPYQYGGSDVDGFDCSGFVWYVYDCFGIQIPRTAKKQGKMEKHIRLKKALPGDIIVFKLKGGWHTGILLGKSHFVHAPKRGEKIRKQVFNSFWKNHLKYTVSVIADQ